MNENTFVQLVNLNYICLNSNKLEFYPEKFFQFNLELEEIDLSYNQLYFLSQKTFSKFKNLNQLDLNNNTCVSKSWNSNASQSMEDIEEILKDCNDHYIAAKGKGPIEVTYFESLNTKSTLNVDEMALLLFFLVLFLLFKAKTLIETSNGEFENVEKTAQAKFNEMDQTDETLLKANHCRENLPQIFVMHKSQNRDPEKKVENFVGIA